MDRAEEREIKKQQLISKLSQNVNRGRLAEEFVSGRFFSDFIRPFMVSRDTQIAKGSLWSPMSGVARVDAVALGCAHSGGRNDELKRWQAEIDQWIAKGQASQKRLKRLLEAK
jgi:hypothetical protein